MTRRLPLALLVFTLSLPAFAVDLSTHTVGVGATAQFAGQLAESPAQLSVRFPLKPRLTAGLLLGLEFSPGSTIVPGLEIDWVLLPETHMNLLASFAVALNLGSPEGLRYFQYQVGPAVELFTSDWPNLGFLLGFGFTGAVSSRSFTATEPGFTTALLPFGSAGIHYYF